MGKGKGKVDLLSRGLNEASEACRSMAEDDVGKAVAAVKESLTFYCQSRHQNKMVFSKACNIEYEMYNSVVQDSNQTTCRAD